MLLHQLQYIQIPIPANVFNYITSYLPKDFVKTHPNIMSYIGLNSFDPASFDAFIILVENCKWW